MCTKRQQELILMVGLPRSGKTTWAKEYVKENPNTIIVSPDTIRFALHGKRFIVEAEEFVWAIHYTMVKTLLLQGYDVLVDATNTTEKRRKPYHYKFKNCNIMNKIITTSKEECIRRATTEGDNDIIPIIEKMAEQYEECLNSI